MTTVQYRDTNFYVVITAIEYNLMAPHPWRRQTQIRYLTTNPLDALAIAEMLAGVVSEQQDIPGCDGRIQDRAMQDMQEDLDSMRWHAIEPATHQHPAAYIVRRKLNNLYTNGKTGDTK